MTRLPGFTDLLIPDECGHRALEETLADWREERARAGSAFARGGTDMRALAGIARVFAMIAGAGLGRTDVWRCFTWTIIGAAVASGTLVLATNPPRVAGGSPLLLLLLVPHGMMVGGCGVAAAFGLGLRGSRRMPGLTLCALMLATMVGLFGYVAPKTQAIYYQQAFPQFSDVESRTARPPRLAPGNAEEDAAEQLRRRGAARGVPFLRLAVLVSPVPLLLLGAALRARFSEARAWPLVQVTSGVLAIGIFVASAVACAAIQAPTRWNQTMPLWWSAIAVSLIVTLWLTRRAEPEHPRTREPDL